MQLPQPASILLVDDIRPNLVALEAALSNVDFGLVTAQSGREALKCLLVQDFAVIVLDIHMPGLDGFETARLIRARDKSHLTPIIFLTADNRSGERVLEGYRLGAVDYIYKPFDADILRAKVSFFVDLFRKTVALEQRTAELGTLGRMFELASKHKSHFLANMSHELRTPLNAIIGFSEIMLDRNMVEVPEAQRATFLAHIRDSGQHLLGLIDTILDISKVEAGRMDLQLESVALGELIEGCVAIVQAQASQKNITLEAECELPQAQVTADRTRLKQIAYNLLSNAVKFTHDGGHVSVRTHIGRQQVRVEVQDNGVGIKPEDQGRIFEEFWQAVAAPGRQSEGTGLGLALVRRLVELHGGTVGLQSSPGKGSCFTVSLPRNGPAVETRIAA